MAYVNMMEHMRNKDNPNGKDNHGWYAGGQLKALKFYLTKKAKIIAEFMEDDYQGNCFAIIKFKRKIIIWRDGFGSCSGCDGLEGENGYEYIKSTLSEGNTKQFKNLKEAREFVRKDRCGRWSEWRGMPIKMFDNIKKVMCE